MSQKPILFSIIIPMYKVEPYLEQCLKSVFNQSYQNFECFVVNDGSPGVESLDWPYRVPEYLTNKPKESQASIIFKENCGNDSKFQYFFRKNSGVSETKNFALSKIAGEYLVILDADDYLDKNYLANASKAIENNFENKILYGNVKIYKDGKICSFSSSQKFLPNDNNLKSMLVFPTWTVTPVNYFWNIKIIKKHNLHYKFSDGGEDTAFVLDNVIAHQKEFKQINFEQAPDIFYYYRQFDNQMTKQKGYQVKLFENTTRYIKSRLQSFKEIGYIYYLLGMLFIWRFSLYRRKLLLKDSLLRYLLSFLAKFITLFAILISGTRKLK